MAIWLLWLKPGTSDIVTPNQVVQSGWADLYKIQNDADLQALTNTTQNIFSEFTTSRAGTDGWQTFSKDAKQISTTIGLPALKVQIPDQIKSFLNTADWGVHSCKSASNEPRFVLRLLFALGTQGELITYAGKQELFKKWEQTMLQDVQSVIFPSSFYVTDLVTRNPYITVNTFDVPDMRTTNIVTGVTLVSEFGYVIAGDHAFIGNDIACMNQIAVNVLGLVP